ncbi:hypothetical protein ASPBRDRAFT_40403 [Aspergillus brasiliensis CBS 101740]|uniref:Nucleoside phosphorylase domain-containing protein n=1 Tax=Aspergillus brasiliensis (strain CBS 101740 / IMI 381727 / IBT 21946) TaxID=767769 RepID=A0A1L9UTV6_ASPBC|nr:hypothetical protein ASPBRDRAFT_40403 [Aspergillus brasiliensis CBS 101740]
MQQLRRRPMQESFFWWFQPHEQRSVLCGYCLGRMKGFNVVAAGLPYDDYGTNSATNVASHLIRTFPRVKFCLVVGIGGGVPSAALDLRLGDVVVGTGVIQCDLGKWIQNSEFKITAQKQQPPPYLRAVITKIRSNGLISFESALNPLLDDLYLIASMRPEYLYPGADRDMLFDSGDVHVEKEPTCDNCLSSRRGGLDSMTVQTFSTVSSHQATNSFEMQDTETAWAMKM